MSATKNNFLKHLRKTSLSFCLTGMLFVASMFLSCSFNVSFFIHNNSKQPITVSYTLNMPHTHGVFVINPTIYDFSNYKSRDYPEGTKVNYDNASQTVTAQLEKNEALFVGTDLNFTLTNPEERERSCRYIEQLVIVKHNTDTLVYTRKMVSHLFKEFGNYKVGIRIE